MYVCSEKMNLIYLWNLFKLSSKKSGMQSESEVHKWKKTKAGMEGVSCLLGFGAYLSPTCDQVNTEGVEVLIPQTLEIILG